mgnify:CR=1 FL=1
MRQLVFLRNNKHKDDQGIQIFTLCVYQIGKSLTLSCLLLVKEGFHLYQVCYMRIYCATLYVLVFSHNYVFENGNYSNFYLKICVLNPIVWMLKNFGNYLYFICFTSIRYQYNTFIQYQKNTLCVEVDY